MTNNIKLSYSTDSMDTAREYDTNDFYEIKNNPISKSGVFEYLGKNIPDAENPNKMYKVYRPESEVNNSDTINSFKLLPFIDDHEMLGKDATPAEKKGVHGVIGEDIYFKDGILYANLKIFSESLKNLIENGKKELSCGFKNLWVKEEGTTSDGESYDYIQTNIRGNHIALVEAGRMGKDVAVLDSKDQSNSNERIVMDEELKAMLTEIIGRLDKLEKMEKVESEISEDEEVEAKAMDAEPCEKAEDAEPTEKSEDEKIEKKDDKSMDSKNKSFDAAEFAEKVKKEMRSEFAEKVKKEMRSEFAEKVKLHDALKPHIGSFDHLDMDLNAVVSYGVKKLGISCDAKDAKATLNGYLVASKAKNGVSVDAKENTDNSVSKYLKGGN